MINTQYILLNWIIIVTQTQDWLHASNECWCKRKEAFSGPAQPGRMVDSFLKDHLWGSYRIGKGGVVFSFVLFCLIFKLFYCCSITVVCIFSLPLYPTPDKPTSLPCLHPPPWFCPCVIYNSS